MKIEALCAGIIGGEQSGPSKPFDVEEFISRKRRKKKRSAKVAA